MTNVVNLRTPIQEASLELYHRFKGKFWFHGVAVIKNQIIVYCKKGKMHHEWLGNDDTYKSFKYVFKEQEGGAPLNLLKK